MQLSVEIVLNVFKRALGPASWGAMVLGYWTDSCGSEMFPHCRDRQAMFVALVVMVGTRRVIFWTMNRCVVQISFSILPGTWLSLP